jgi:predicted  nucleic acid-binding Zn-ribbon protein
MRISTIDFIWDVYRDDPSRLWSGEAAAKLEIDRLIKRVQKLDAQKADLEAQLAQINADLAEINARIEELRRQ